MADEITISVDDSNEPTETETEENPTWLPNLLEVVSSSRELMSEMRGQQAAQSETNQLLRSLAETLIQTNANLTAQLAAQSTPPPSPEIVVVETPPSDTQPADASVTDPLEVEKEAPPQPVVRRGLRSL